MHKDLRCELRSASVEIVTCRLTLNSQAQCQSKAFLALFYYYLSTLRLDFSMQIFAAMVYEMKLN